MALLRWNEFFETGIDVVDAQHRHLVDIVNQAAPILASAGDRIPEGVQGLFDKLFSYAAEHFATEESVMNDCSVDPRHKVHHLESHQVFVQRVQEMAQSYLQGNAVTGKRILSFVANWLVFHILGEDQAMARQISAIAKGNSPETAFDITGGTATDPAQEALTNALVDMYSLLSEQNRELEDHRSHLEKLVDERTAELKTTTEALAETQFAMDFVGIGIHWVNAETGKILHVNQYAADLLGYSVAEMLNFSVPDIDPNFNLEGFKKDTESLRQRGTVHFETIQRSKDGINIPVNVSLHFLPHQGDLPPRFVAFITNITDKKNAELALVQAKEAAEAANVAKSTFLANMSHEIRTPLNAITGMAHIIRRAGLPEEQEERLQKIEIAGHHLLEIINSILDLSKIEAGKLVLEEIEINVGELMANVASILSERVKSKHLVFALETNFPPIALIGDPTRIKQCLLNYATNAIKFTEYGLVSLDILKSGESSETVTLDFLVRDTGCGIPENAHERIFSPFEQFDSSTTRSYGGTGLGLAISRRLVRMMGGDIQLNSSAGTGSAFSFTLTFDKHLAPQGAEGENLCGEEAEKILRRDFAGSRILLAEDDWVNQEVAHELLHEVFGLQVDLANNGNQAVRMASSTTYQLILMDMQMPDLDGVSATRQIRQLPGYQQTPIVAMTANAFESDRQDCLEAGMSDFISKPVDPDLLAITLVKWLQHKAAT